MTDPSTATRGRAVPELGPVAASHDEGVGAVDRWSPSRAGLVNVWRFDEETFGFHRGRLLLRGPNGAGKSMALELLFPFLLDADASPFRLTSGVKARGGLYDRVMTGTDAPSRVGFVWGEFRSGSEVFTLGARLRASSATRRADTDWFTARLEVGRDLHLLDGDRVPVSRAGLAAAIGDAGRVHDSGQDYRAAVRAALFPGFSPAQYDALVTALLALRREKISQDLNPAKLSEVLTASLPALDEKDVSEIAEGFQRLDRRRDELARLESDLAQVKDLARRQRDYARRVVVSIANEVRAAETGRDDVTRKEREARAQLAEANEARERCIAEAEAAAARVGDLTAETETLRNLDAYREGAQLEQLQHRRAQLATDVERAREAAGRRRKLFDEAADALARAGEAVGARRADLARAAAELGSAAEALGVGPTVDQASALADPDEAEGLLAAWTESRRAQLAEVERALAHLEERIRVRDDRDEAVEAERRILQARDAERG
ncbi:MAG TPA: TIGR02680 family protein, partial [Actinomycetota bacterium]|nr:TIGR02680 family protein [Actinomycetota bacterium]